MKKVIVVILLLIVSSGLWAETVLLDQIIEETGSVLSWDPLLERGVLSNGDKRVVFSLFIPWMLFNYSEKIDCEFARDDAGRIVLPDQTARELRNFLIVNPSSSQQQRVAVILIDPGHGGQDPGTIGYFTENGEEQSLYEKTVVLDVALRLAELLKQKYPDIRVEMTRSNDTFPSLEERVEKANVLAEDLSIQEAILFISIHVNYSINSRAQGYEVWYLPPDFRRDVLDSNEFSDGDKDLFPVLNAMTEESYSIDSTILGKYILDGLDSSVGSQTDNRGMKEESWYVVRNAMMPSVLVELGFLSHQEELARFRDSLYLQKLAEGLYNGVDQFIEYFNQ